MTCQFARRIPKIWSFEFPSFCHQIQGKTLIKAAAKPPRARFPNPQTRCNVLRSFTEISTTKCLGSYLTLLPSPVSFFIPGIGPPQLSCSPTQLRTHPCSWSRTWTPCRLASWSVIFSLIFLSSCPSTFSSVTCASPSDPDFNPCSLLVRHQLSPRPGLSFSGFCSSALF